jgi:hypothetical protein
MTAPKLTAFTVGHALPDIRPANTRRDWMDASPDAFAYRCLPLTIANGHGWEIRCDCEATATWNGGQRPEDVTVTSITPGTTTPLAHFGAGVLTFHVNVLFRTEPGTSLWVSGPPNVVKDGIAPLTGIVETDWSPMTFTMNWRFTRPGHPVRFVPGEPFCFFFPLPRHLVSQTEPVVRSLADAPDTEREFRHWSSARGQFNTELDKGGPAREQKWQKTYHRGRMPLSGTAAPDHITRVAPKPFVKENGS